MTIGCATAGPELAVVLVTFDAAGAITRVDSDDLAADDPRRQACARFVSDVRTSLHGATAGEGSVRFGCPLASFTPHTREAAR